MQVPEKLSLIGGSILLASTLAFTLKSQASSVIPHVGHSISGIFDHIGDAQKASDFDSNFKDAKKNGETTGMWGTSKYYISKDDSLHVGKGSLQGNLLSVIGQDRINKLKSINIDNYVQAPTDSTYLFAGIDSPYGDGNHSIVQISGLSNVDTSHVTNMSFMFNKLRALHNIDLSNWDTKAVTTTQAMFDDDQSLVQANLSGWNTKQDTNMSWMFNTGAIQDLNINTFDTTHAKMDEFLGDGWNPGGTRDHLLSTITLGRQTKLSGSTCLSNSDWNNGNQTINTSVMNDGNSHPGTWTKQYEKAPNLSPVHEYGNWSGSGWLYNWSFRAEKGKTYYLSADYHHVTQNSATMYSVQANGRDGNAEIWNGGYNYIPTGQSGTSVAKWTANQTGDVAFGLGDNVADKVTNITITQSNSYVPYDKTIQNK